MFILFRSYRTNADDRDSYVSDPRLQNPGNRFLVAMLVHATRVRTEEEEAAAVVIAKAIKSNGFIKRIGATHGTYTFTVNYIYTFL